MSVGEDIPSPEQGETIYDAPHLLQLFEEIGEAFYEDWELHNPRACLVHSKRVKEPFTLASGATGEFRWLENPSLYRPGLPELGTGKRWLPSGDLKAVETDDDRQVSTVYRFGRNLSANTHQPDYAIVI